MWVNRKVLDARTQLGPRLGVKGPRLEDPDFKPGCDRRGLGELAVHGDRVRPVDQHLLVRV